MTVKRRYMLVPKGSKRYAMVLKGDHALERIRFLKHHHEKRDALRRARDA